MTSRKTINQVLSIGPSTTEIQYYSYTPKPHISISIESSIATLHNLTKKLSITYLDTKPTSGIPQAYYKFWKAINNPELSRPLFNLRELRCLSFALNYKETNYPKIIDNTSNTIYALKIIDQQWRDSYLSGLIECLLSNWSHNPTPSLSELDKFIQTKLANYTGHRSKFKALKENARFLAIAKGDILLGAQLANSENDIDSITSYIKAPESWITFPYFRGVVTTYIDKTKHISADKIISTENFLKLHCSNVSGTKSAKIIISRLICRNETPPDEIEDLLKNIALTQIGDPESDASWGIDHSYQQEDIEFIKKAREILNHWLTRLFINIFFETCLNDPRRRAFWIRYSRHMKNIKVLGPKYIKSVLKRDKRISSMVDTRYKTTLYENSKAALVFSIKDNVLIEFSDKGYAFYSYKSNSQFLPNLQSSISTVDSLRNGFLPVMVRRSGYTLYDIEPEGRLIHNDTILEWEEVFSAWLKHILHIHA